MTRPLAFARALPDGRGLRLLGIPLLAWGCAAPQVDELFQRVDVAVVDGGLAAGSALRAVADEAEETLSVALPGLTDPDLTDALLAAFERGVDVRVVVDEDRAGEAGVVALEEAGVSVALADGPISYFDFGSNRDVAWTSDQARMTHAFAVADRTRFAMATAAGDTGGGTRVVFEGRGEELGEDLITEHTQVFGGSDATSTTAFDNLAKSIADARWAYPTQTPDIFELWLNPQERGIKRIVDAIYGARASVRVLTEDMADEGLARALQAKARDGFDVEVMVGSTFGATSSALSDVLRNQAPDVPLLQVVTPDPLPTLVFVDFTRARDGAYHQPRVYALTHPIWSSARLFAEVEVVTDQLVDGALYVLGADGRPTITQQELAQVYLQLRELAEVLR